MKPVYGAGLLLVGLVVGLAIGLSVFQPPPNQVTVTTTQLTTMTSTSVLTKTKLGMGAFLANFSGSGEANSQPFTATSSMANITLTVSSTTPQESAVAWFIYPVSSSVYTATGSVNGVLGTSSSYAYGLASGEEYYVSVISANANWRVVVNAVG